VTTEIAIVHHHDQRLVVLSIIISVLAAFAARELLGRIKRRAVNSGNFTAKVERLEMDPPVRTACFRGAQEAITNASRHARAATLAAELRAEADRVWLLVSDDGVGFDTAAMQQRSAHGSSLGLLSIKERVSLLRGDLKVSSSPGDGSEIRAWFPLAPPGPDVTT
jgi:signal transduction histidine kinase